MSGRSGDQCRKHKDSDKTRDATFGVDIVLCNYCWKAAHTGAPAAKDGAGDRISPTRQLSHSLHEHSGVPGEYFVANRFHQTMKSRYDICICPDGADNVSGLDRCDKCLRRDRCVTSALAVFLQHHEQAEQRLIEEFGKKSYEYGIYSGETELSETNETNETNELRQHRGVRGEEYRHPPLVLGRGRRLHGKDVAWSRYR
eukprot:COSAG02_NODE_2165_length_9612_cov_20.785451_4_plen_200_part_00